MNKPFELWFKKIIQKPDSIRRILGKSSDICAGTGKGSFELREYSSADSVSTVAQIVVCLIFTVSDFMITGPLKKFFLMHV